MRLTFNIRHLEQKPLHLEGDLSVQDLELEEADEMIHLKEPLKYSLDLEKLNQSVLAQGTLQLPLHCECVRCLKPFDAVLDLPDWICDLPLTGEEAVPIENDLVDLTPSIREDILLAFPQHPLCDKECSGLPEAPQSQSQQTSGAYSMGEVSSAWAELNKLKF